MQRENFWLRMSSFFKRHKSFLGILSLTIVLFAGVIVSEEQLRTFSSDLVKSVPFTQRDVEPNADIESADSKMQPDFEVLYTETGFEPSRLVVPVGSTVGFKNITNIPMWVGSDPHPEHTDNSDFDAREDYAQDELYMHTFDSTGTLGYHNHKKSIHRGVVTVKDLSTTTIERDKTPLSQRAVRDELIDMLHPDDPNTIFTVIDTIQDDTELALSCHDIAHDLGHQAYELYGFSEAMTFNNPNHVNHPLVQYICAGGYMHGILEELSLHQPEFMENPDMICSALSEVERDSCYHGVGHVFMLARDRNIQESITDCRLVEEETNMYRCFEGVRMEQFWGNTDHVSSDSLGWDVSNPLSTCIEAGADEKPTCFLYAPFGYLREHQKDYFGAVRLCTESGLSDFDSSFCLKGLGITMMSKFNGQNLEGSELYVTGLAPELRYAFYQGVLGYAQLSGVGEAELKNTCNLFKTDSELCLGVHASMEPTFAAYQRLAAQSQNSNSESIKTALTYFNLANARNLVGIEKLFTLNTTFSFENIGVYYGAPQIMGSLRAFFGSYAYLDWDVTSSQEIRAGVVYVQFTFSGQTLDGESVSYPGEAYVIVNGEDIQHLEIRNK